MKQLDEARDHADGNDQIDADRKHDQPAKWRPTQSGCRRLSLREMTNAQKGQSPNGDQTCSGHREVLDMTEGRECRYADQDADDCEDAQPENDSRNYAQEENA